MESEFVYDTSTNENSFPKKMLETLTFQSKTNSKFNILAN